MELVFEIKTNGRFRDLLTYWDLPRKVRKDFDYIDEDTEHDQRFFKYRGVWYDANEFTPTNGAMFGQLKQWPLYQSDSHFSGVVLKYDEEFEQICVGTYIC